MAKKSVYVKTFGCQSKAGPNPKQSKILSPKNGLDNFRSGFGTATKCLRVYIRTFGWPMDKLLHSDFTLLEGVV